MHLSDLCDILPYEKCKKYGAASLSDRELLAVIIRSGTHKRNCLDIADDILKSSGIYGLSGIMHLGISSLCRIEGIGEVKAIQLLCVAELCLRISRSSKRDMMYFNDAQSIAAYFMDSMRHLDVEQLRVMMLDSKCGLLHEMTLSMGSASRTILSPRELYRAALEHNARNVIILHNHPSGDPTPSADDVEATNTIKKGGELMEIPLLDHIIIGDGRYYSFRENLLM